MDDYVVDISDDAETDLSYYRAYERRIILEAALTTLRCQPGCETRNQKKLRENPIAPWELKIGNYRVFYAIDSDVSVVIIVSIGLRSTIPSTSAERWCNYE